MYAVAVVRYVKSEVFRVGLDTRIYEKESGNATKMEINFRWKAARNHRIQYSLRTSPRQQHHTPTLIFDFVPF